MPKSSKINQEDISNIEIGSSEMPSIDWEAKIAEMAYLKAESRGFTPGQELNDWLEAEQELSRS